MKEHCIFVHILIPFALLSIIDYQYHSYSFFLFNKCSKIDQILFFVFYLNVMHIATYLCINSFWVIVCVLSIFKKCYNYIFYIFFMSIVVLILLLILFIVLCMAFLDYMGFLKYSIYDLFYHRIPEVKAGYIQENNYMWVLCDIFELLVSFHFRDHFLIFLVVQSMLFFKSPSLWGDLTISPRLWVATTLLKIKILLSVHFCIFFSSSKRTLHFIISNKRNSRSFWKNFCDFTPGSSLLSSPFSTCSIVSYLFHCSKFQFLFPLSKCSELHSGPDSNVVFSFSFLTYRYPFIIRFAKQNGITDTSVVVETYEADKSILYSMVLEKTELFVPFRSMPAIDTRSF